VPQIQRQIFERVLITRTRVIPLPGEVLVREGDLVAPQDIMAKAETIPGDPYVVDLRAELNIKIGPEDVAKLMIKRVGERVVAKEPLARAKVGAFGDVHEACSPVTGVIEFISHAYARVLVREDAQNAAPVVLINVAKKLDIPAVLIRAYMRYQEGDEVRQGAAIADDHGAVGIGYCYAPATGVIEKICTRSGIVTIVRPTKQTQVDAYLLGRVAEVIHEKGARVEAVASYVQGVFGIGFENYGVVRVVAPTPKAILTAQDITEDHEGAILIGGAGITLEALRRAADHGVRGIITGGASHADLSALLGREIGVGITGQEDLPLTLILTEGFGAMPMADDTYDLLRSADGRLASVNGSTQVRAGVVRPEIVLSNPGGGDDKSRPKLLEDCLLERERERGEVALGAKVRIVRNPKFGQWGKIVNLPEAPVRLATEACLPSAEVELEDGLTVFVPLANLEVF
jgi:hypothetical protein